jgi:hypothetical protein
MYGSAQYVILNLFQDLYLVIIFVVRDVSILHLIKFKYMLSQVVTPDFTIALFDLPFFVV